MSHSKYSKLPNRPKSLAETPDTLSLVEKKRVKGSTVTPYTTPEPPHESPRIRKREHVSDTIGDESKADERAHPELTDTYATLKKRWVVSVEEDIETCDAITNSHLGSKFIEWVLELNEQKDNPGANLDIDLAKYLPPIDVSVKIYAIYAVDVPNNCFECTFNVMLDWEDHPWHFWLFPTKKEIDC